MKKKYPALKKHICRFNDGDCICECFDKGYKKAKADIIKQIQKDINLLGINNDVWEDNYKQVLKRNNGRAG